MLVQKMRYQLNILCILFFVFLIGKGFSQAPEPLSYNIINTFSSPGPSPQGLNWDGNFLWVSDDSMRLIYKLDPSNGMIISFFRSPGPDPRGLTWDGDYLWCSDDNTKNIFKLDSSGVVIKSIPAPEDPPCNTRGLTWDGKHLWSAFFAGWSSKVNQVDTTNGTIKRWFYGCGTGLAFDGNYLWVVDSQEGHYKGFVDKRDFSGKWLAYFRTPGYYPTGLAFDGNYFWLADCELDTIYKIKIIQTSVKMTYLDPCLPTSFRCYNYPNPFNQYTKIIYELPFDSYVSINLFNIRGDLVRSLIDNRNETGIHIIQWDGKNNFGENCTSGIYYYRFETERFFSFGKITIIR